MTIMVRILGNCWSWLRSAKRKPFGGLLSVRFDERKVEVVVLGRLEPAWNQTFLWADIKQVCCKDEGLAS